METLVCLGLVNSDEVCRREMLIRLRHLHEGILGYVLDIEEKKRLVYLDLVNDVHILHEANDSIHCVDSIKFFRT